MADFKVWRWFNECVFKLNFYRVHLSYFIFVILLSSVIVYGSTTNHNSGNAEAEYYLRYIDALSICTSAMTNTGLNVINLGSITGFQQAVLFILIMMGNVTTVSTATVFIRKFWFKRKMRDFLAHSKAGRAVVQDIERDESGQGRRNTSEDTAVMTGVNQSPKGDNATKKQRRMSEKAQREQLARVHHEHELGGFPMPWESATFRSALSSPFKSLRAKPNDQPHSYLSFEPSLDQKGRFRSLGEKEREELGGVEYKALHILSWLLPAYILFWLILGIIFLVPYSYRSSVQSIVRGSQPGNLKPGWWSSFLAVSSFANCGFSLLNSNMIPYYYILITLFKLVPKNSEMHHTLAFLLHHPRRCFILLFPSINTWYLLAAQLGIDFVLWAAFGILNIGLGTVTYMSAGVETIDGLYQALGVRTGGLYLIQMSMLAPALLVLYMVGMYISGFPILLSLRQTNIYEERSLGLGADATGSSDSDEQGKNDSEKSYLGTHIRKQLAYDIWGLVLAVFLICIIERRQLVDSSPGFNIFNIIFEILSAYGTVGLSTGYPLDNYSFSGVWHTLSKLILVVVMIRGRHRGLPYAIDRAVLLPGEELMERMDREYSGGKKEGGELREQMKKVRSDERGEQVETKEQGQDPEENAETRKKFQGSSEEGPS